MAEPLLVGNCSGFYGDRLSAMREMLEGGPLDVLTGDYLAELTMLILGRDRMRDPDLGYARTFLTQLGDCLRLAIDRRVRIVANAGGLNPAGLAAQVRALAEEHGVTVRVAHVAGDDLLTRAEELGLAGAGAPLTANAYLGAAGIAAALRGGADVVVTGRVTDASMVVGPAMAAFGWGVSAYDRLAGAVVAGHVLECGAHATGGNFSGFRALLEAGRCDRPLGFPIAEVYADGSSVITKHPGTGGVVSVDTVTAQLVYEIQSAAYLGPDVTTHLDSVRLTPQGPDRVRIDGVRGSAPPVTLKVGLNHLGGFRNQADLVLTGLDIEAKARWVRAQLEAAWRATGASFAAVDWSLARTDHPDAAAEEEASARLRVTVRDSDPARAGKAFTAPLVELALASYPGFTMTSPPSAASPFGVFSAVLVDRSAVPQVVHHADGSVQTITAPEHRPPASAFAVPSHPPAPGPTARETCRVPLGRLVQARSGDKGGDANLGLWVSPDDPRAEDRSAWLLSTVTPDWVRGLLPEVGDLEIEVHPLPNLRAVNIVLAGLLGQGVAAGTRFDPQAKGLGEWARARFVEVPEELA